MKKGLLVILMLCSIIIFSQSKKYAFMVFKAREQINVGLQVPEYKIVDKVSEISEIRNYNNDQKAKFEDEIINFYLNTGWGFPKVLSKKTYVFNSYSEASKKRNSFLIGE